MRLRLISLVLCFLMILSLAPGAGAAEASPLKGFDGGYTYVRFGSYPHGDASQKEGILWRVLQTGEGQATLLAEQVLDARQADSTLEAFVDFENSALYKWLSGDFAAAAFTDAERAAFAGEGLTLATSEQIKDKALGFTGNKQRTTSATAYARANGADTRASYWLKNQADANRYSLRRVLNDGGVGYSAVTKVFGIRPVVSVQEEMVSVASGEGTKDSPYVLEVTPETLAKVAREKAAEEERLRLEEEAKAKAKAEQEAREAEEKAAAEAELAEALSKLEAAKAAGQDTALLQQAAEDAQIKLSMIGGMEVEGFPLLTREGFLPEGEEEFVEIDADNGLWRYCSQDVRIEIKRYEETYEKNRPVRYLAAEVFVREGTQGFHTIPYTDNRTVDRDAYKAKQNVIAQENNVVLALGADYYLYRTNRPGIRVGIVIRDGEILFDDAPNNPKTNYPPLDLMALYPDLDMKLFGHGETTAQQLVQQGARDVIAFGPWLVRNGEVNMEYTTYGYNFEPRVGIGMVEKGHYWVLIAEGRIRPSRGMTCRETAYVFQELGCTEAFNLDGGWTSSLIFMGQQLNQLDNSGIHNNARTQNEILGVGYTPNMAQYQPPETKK